MLAAWWLNAYAELHDDVETGAEATVFLDAINEAAVNEAAVNDGVR